MFIYEVSHGTVDLFYSYLFFSLISIIFPPNGASEFGISYVLNTSQSI